MQVLDDRLELCRKLRDDDHVGAPGQAAHHRDPTGVATHHLDDHHPVVRGGRGMQAIECLDDDPDRGIEADAELGDGEVIVDRLGDADHRIAGVAHGGRDRECVVAADRHQAVNTAAAEQADDLLDATFLLEGVGAGGPQDGAAQRQDAAHRGRTQILEVARAE
jgi:hypothetical protein